MMRKVDLAVRGLPLGWHAVVEHDWVWLEGKGAHPVRAVIWTDRDSSEARDSRIPPDAFPRVEGWTDFDHRYIPIGGIHRLANPGTELLEVVEVQTGDYLEEDDITRYEDIYARA